MLSSDLAFGDGRPLCSSAALAASVFSGPACMEDPSTSYLGPSIPQREHLQDLGGGGCGLRLVRLFEIRCCRGTGDAQTIADVRSRLTTHRTQDSKGSALRACCRVSLVGPPRLIGEARRLHLDKHQRSRAGTVRISGESGFRPVLSYLSRLRLFPLCQLPQYSPL